MVKGGWGTDPDLAQKQPMRDILSQHEGGHQVVDGPSLSTVWPQHKCVEAPLPGGHEDSISSAHRGSWAHTQWLCGPGTRAQR